MYTSNLILRLIDVFFSLIAFILGLRIILELFGANSSTPFVLWVYEVSSALLYPFRGIFPSTVIRPGFILDISALVALFIYALLAYFLSELVRFTAFHSTRYYTAEDERISRK